MAKAVTVTILVSRFVNYWKPTDFVFAASSTVAVSFAVISGCEAKLSSNVARRQMSSFFASPLTRSLSVIIPNGLPRLVTIMLPTFLNERKI
jgi:hypothetical protein